MSMGRKIASTIRETLDHLDKTTNAAQVELFLGRLSGLQAALDELEKAGGDMAQIEQLRDQARVALRDERAIRYIVVNLVHDLARDVERGDVSLTNHLRHAYQRVDATGPK